MAYDDDDFRRMINAFRYAQDLAERSRREFEHSHRTLKKLIEERLLDANNLERLVRESVRATTLERLAQEEETLARRVREISSFSYMPAEISAAQRLLENRLDDRAIRDLKTSFAGLLEEQRRHTGALGSLEVLDRLLPDYSRWVHAVELNITPESARQLRAQARDLSTQLTNLYSALPGKEVDEKETEEHAGQAASVAEERLADSFAQRNPFALLHGIEKTLGAVKSGAVKLSPFALKLLYDIMVNLLSAIILLSAQEAPERPRSNRETISIVKKIDSSIPSLPPDIYVVVASNYLVVRSGPGIKNPAVGQLYPGEIIKVLRRKTRSWTLVEFQDQSGDVVIRGWVYSRYIRRLRGRAEGLMTASLTAEEKIEAED